MFMLVFTANTGYSFDPEPDSTKGASDAMARIRELDKAAVSQYAVNNDTLPYLGHLMLDELQKNKAEINDFDLNFHFGNAWYYLSDYSKAIGYYRKSRRIAEKQKSDTLIAKALYRLGNTYNKLAILTGNYIKYEITAIDTARISDSLESFNEYALTALDYFNTSAKLISDHLDHHKHNEYQRMQLAGIYLELSNVYKNLKKHDRSLEYRLMAYDIYENLNNRKRMARTYKEIAWFYMQELNDYKKAIEYGLKALEFRRKEIPHQQDTSSWNINLMDLWDIIETYGVIGFASYRDEDFKTALNSYKKLLFLWKIRGDTNGIIDHHNYIGRAYYELDNYDSAAWYFNKALYISTAKGFRSTEGQSHYNFGLLFSKMKNYDSAVFHLERSLEIRNELGRSQEAGYSMIRLGDVYLEMNKYTESIAFHREALNTGQTIRDGELILTALRKLPQVYKHAGNFKKALEYHIRYKAFTDSIVEQNKSEGILELQARFEVESKEKEIIRQKEAQLQKTRQLAILHGAITLFVLISASAVWLILIQRRREKNKRKWLLAEQKALRSQMNPHFIYNSLTSIQNFVLSKQNETANEYLTEFSSLLRLILDNSKKNFIPLSEELQSLKKYLKLEQMRFRGKFTTVVKLDLHKDESLIMIPPLLIQPLLENAILHGLTPLENKEGKLMVNFIQKNNDVLMCMIEDNGIGRKKAAEINMNRINHNSSGVTNITERLELLGNQLNKKLIFEIIDMTDEHGMGTGTRVKLEIPFTMKKHNQ